MQKAVHSNPTGPHTEKLSCVHLAVNGILGLLNWAGLLGEWTTERHKLPPPSYTTLTTSGNSNNHCRGGHIGYILPLPSYREPLPFRELLYSYLFIVH